MWFDCQSSALSVISPVSSVSLGLPFLVWPGNWGLFILSHCAFATTVPSLWGKVGRGQKQEKSSEGFIPPSGEQSFSNRRENSSSLRILDSCRPCCNCQAGHMKTEHYFKGTLPPPL